MNTKEMANKIIELRSEAYDLDRKISKAVSNYIDKVYGSASCNDPASKDIIGLVCKEECSWNYDKTNNLICISFSTFRNEWGDLTDNSTEINVDPNIIDNYYEVL